MFINLIDFNNFVRPAETVGLITYPLVFDPTKGQKMTVANDGLVLDPSYKTLGTT